MAEGIVKKKRIRAGHRSSATRVMSEATEAVSSRIEGGTTDAPNLSKLRYYKSFLLEKMDVLSEMDEEILETAEEEEIEYEIEQADVFKERMQLVVMNIDEVLDAHAHPHARAPNLKPPEAVVRSLADGPRSSTELPRRESHARSATPIHGESRGVVYADISGYRPTVGVKLPKLTLKRFNGDLTRWTAFWDSFQSAVHDNPSLSDVDKFNYLNSQLEGPASEAVAGLKLTSANYGEAVSILQKRFGNRQQIISKHMDKLLTINAVGSQYNLKGLRQLYDLVESQTRGLRALGVPSESYGSLLSSVLMNKLPAELRLVIGREAGDSEIDLDTLMKIFERELAVRERAASTNGGGQPSRKPSKFVPTATALVSGSTSLRCCYCGQSHSSSTCESVVEPEVRKSILMKSGRCFVCLKKFHRGRDCRSSIKCSNCGGRHHISICSRGEENRRGKPPAERGANPPVPPTPERTPPASSVNFVGAKVPVLLQTARAQVHKVSDPQSAVEARVLFDSGSQRSYTTKRLATRLSLNQEHTETMLIKTFGSTRESKRECAVVKVGMALRDGTTFEMSLFTVPFICEPLTIQPITYAKDKYPHLADLELADFASGDEALEVDILIGSEYYWKLVTGAIVQCGDGPTAISTRLGWVLSGPLDGSPPRGETSLNLMTTHSLKIDAQGVSNPRQDLDETLKMFWELEALGINKDELSVYEGFQKNISFKEGRYEVSLPWKDVHPALPNNRDLSMKRLDGLLRRLRQSPLILCEYNAIIREQLAKGIVEAVEKPEVLCGEQAHYLPHHAVVRQDKTTTKLRIVYDASAKSRGPSLNDCLYTGPKFHQSILDIILRFRTHPVALAADIEKAFLMISVSESDRDALRFLWVDDIHSEAPEIVTMRFARVVFGVSSSPFLLNATIQYHLQKYCKVHPEFVKIFLRSIYVDDVSFGSKNVNGAFDLFQKAKSVLAEGGFNLRKFVTNSSELHARIEQAEQSGNVQSTTKGNNDRNITEEDVSYAQNTLGGVQPSEAHKILGVTWKPVEDVFVFDLSSIEALVKKLEPTKRSIVGVATRFYDPLGFVSPVTIRFKLLFQELCVSKCDWDEPLMGDMLRKWKSLVSTFQGVSIAIPRLYFHSPESEVGTYSLQGFCDASIGAYAAVVYIKAEVGEETSVRFVASKTRVAPANKQTIPRLELLAALLLARLITSISMALEPEIPLSTPTCFSDSKVALYWIRGIDKEWKPFVQNRVNEIRRLLSISCWNHCPGKENPADLPSRGVTPLELSGSILWLHGPDWLSRTGIDMGKDDYQIPEECLQEMKIKSLKQAHSLFIASDKSKLDLNAVIKTEGFSNFRHLLRVTAYVLKFVRLLKHRTQVTEPPPIVELNAADLTEAEILWVKDVQSALAEDKRFQEWKRQFRLFVGDDGLYRCKGRLGNADLPYPTKFPALLCRQHHVTSLIVKDAHERVMHNGVKETLTELRTRYWIVKGRQFIRRILHGCIVCRKHEGKPYYTPASPPLPEFRVKPEPPFTYTGVDFAGPLFVKTTESEQSGKVWICLYTCCVVRAVHLDIVPDMTAEAFIRCFKRFTARRGFPRKCISDNAKTFKSASKTIMAVVSHPEVQRQFAGIGMEWSFNVEKAPWTGGIFERMVRSVKRCLRKTIGKAVLSYDELLTAVTEVEMILNSRPLSYVSTEDIEEPLTPSHFLIGRRVLSLPDIVPSEHEEDDVEISQNYLTRRMKYINRTLDHFWKRWQTEYLMELRECHRYGSESGTTTEAISIGDIVVVRDDNRPRGLWKLGKVEEVRKGGDGHVRSASVRVHSRGTHSTILRRPLKCLYPLEINFAHSHTPSHTPSTGEEDQVDEPRRRSSRAAARIAKQGIRACLQAEDSETEDSN